jgi:hypothetical protein
MSNSDILNLWSVADTLKQAAAAAGPRPMARGRAGDQVQAVMTAQVPEDGMELETAATSPTPAVSRNVPGPTMAGIAAAVLGSGATAGETVPTPSVPGNVDGPPMAGLNREHLDQRTTAASTCDLGGEIVQHRVDDQEQVQEPMLSTHSELPTSSDTVQAHARHGGNGGRRSRGRGVGHNEVRKKRPGSVGRVDGGGIANDTGEETGAVRKRRATGTKKQRAAQAMERDVLQPFPLDSTVSTPVVAVTGTEELIQEDADDIPEAVAIMQTGQGAQQGTDPCEQLHADALVHLLHQVASNTADEQAIQLFQALTHRAADTSAIR